MEVEKVDDGLTWWPANRARTFAYQNGLNGRTGPARGLLRWAHETDDRGAPILRCKARSIETHPRRGKATVSRNAIVPPWFWEERTSQTSTDNWDVGHFAGNIFVHPANQDEAWMTLNGVSFCAEDLCSLLGVELPRPAPLSESNYIPADLALTGLTRAIGNREEAQALLLDALRGGIIVARGIRIGSLTDSIRLQGAGSRDAIHPIPASFWPDAAADSARWSWSSGAFPIDDKRDALGRIHGAGYRNVEFDKGGLAILSEKFETHAAASSNDPRGSRATSHTQKGRPPKIKAWLDLSVNLMKLINSGDIDDYHTQEALRAKLSEDLEGGLHEDTFKRFVTRVWYEVLDKA